MRPTDRTALHSEHLELGGRMVDFGGWELPQQYTSIRDEHVAVRTAAGLFDLSHMGRVEVYGAGAADFLQRMLTNDVEPVAPGSAQYTLLCREDGGILDDLVIYRRSQDAFLVVVNASNREKDLGWLRSHQPAGVMISDETRQTSLLALQGPRAEMILEAVGATVADIAYFTFRDAEVAGLPVLISRTGYTGEDGFELFIASTDAAPLWRRLLAEGLSHGLLPCGLGARDACRLEAGLRLYGQDMDETVNPYDAGLGWTVKLAKGHFMGSAALARVKQAGPSRRVVGLTTADRSIPRHGTAVSRGGDQLGTVTSGTYSLFLNQGIAMASVGADTARPGETVDLDIRGRLTTAKVVALPIYRGSVRSPAAVKN